MVPPLADTPEGVAENNGYVSLVIYHRWACMHTHFVVRTRMNIYRKTSNISRTLLGKEIVDHSDVVGASPVGAAPTTLNKDNCKTRKKHLKFGIWCVLY